MHGWIDNKELVHIIMETTSLQICRVSQQAGEPGELMCSPSAKVSRLNTQGESVFQFESESRINTDVSVQKLSGRNNALIWRRSVFILYMLSTDWMKPIYNGKGNLLY